MPDGRAAPVAYIMVAAQALVFIFGLALAQQRGAR